MKPQRPIDPTVELRPFRGTLVRWPPVVELTCGTWQGRATVTPIGGARGATSASSRFEVQASWHGPGLDGLPAVDGPVDASDMILVDELALAKAVAGAAIDAIRAHRKPDLRAILRDLKRRE